MENKTIVAIIIAVIVAGGGGYVMGKNAVGDVANTKGADEAIKMMKEQSVSIQKMGAMMNSGGLLMQELGIKYQDEEAISTGKDLEAVGAKYMNENAKASTESDTMKQMMGN